MVFKTARCALAHDKPGLAALVAAALGFALGACSGSTRSDDPGTTGAPRTVRAPSAPASPALVPELPDVSDDDRDGDRIDDALFERLAERNPVDIEVILNGPALQRHLDAFVSLGGQVRHVFAAVSYGWTGRIAPSELGALRDDLGRDLRLIAAPKASLLFLDEATRTCRVRPIWVS